MAYPYNHIKVTFGGTIYSGADIWVNSINFGIFDSNIGFETGDWGDALPALETALTKWFSDSSTFISDAVKLEWIKIAYINKDGAYFREPDILDLDSPVSGGNRKKAAPQITCAITFQTNKLRAPGRFGRIYPPVISAIVGTDGRITEGNANSMRDNAALLLREMTLALTAAGQEGLSPIVASQKTDSNYTIFTVKVGRVLDTQRSRRNAFVEEYTTPADVDLS